ncbi:MAG: M48 family metalloprotease [Desulfovibrionales bacterium]
MKYQTTFSVTGHLKVIILLLLLFLPACQTIEATGERQLTLIGEQQEIQMGKEAYEQIQQTMDLYPDQSLQTYVNELGVRIAASTERPELPWTFHVLDDDVVNAFALPGGYIYVTRGIMTHLENEAQLAGILGHEIAHVTARHSVVRLSKSMLAQFGLGVARIVAPELQSLAQLAGTGLQFLFLKFSREDEIESDLLGVRYMRNVREDPVELMDVMAMLNRVSGSEEGQRLPQWASTHPYPENRLEIIAEHIETLEPVDYLPVERESYLQKIDGMAYGKNPREGIVRKNAFFHPKMRFSFQFPEGWQVINQKQAVIGISPEQDATLQLSLSPQDTMEGALRTFFRQEGISAARTEKVEINGISAVAGSFQARAQQGIVLGRAMFTEFQGRVFQIVGFAAQPRWQAYDRAVLRSMRSFEELTDPELLEAKPLRIEIVRIEESITLDRLHANRGIPIPLEELARLNQIETDETLSPGSLLKIVR